MALLAEIDFYALPAGPLMTRRFTSGAAFKTRPTDVPANVFVDSRLSGQQLLRRDLFDRATTFGVISPGRGQLQLTNIDGALDELLSCAPRAVRLWYSAIADAPFPSAWQAVASATVTRLTADDKLLTLELADRLAVLDKPLLPTSYAGNNVLPAGLEGVDDLKGQRKPRLLGRVANVSPLLVNTSRLIYQLSDQPASISAVYDGGAALTAGAAYSTLADLQATAPVAGQYRVYSGAEGCYLRTGSTPARQLTVDASSSETRAAQLAAGLATAMGCSVHAGDLATLGAMYTTVGLWASGDITALQAIGDLLGSVGAWAAFDAAGTLRMSRLLAPAASADLTLQPWWLKSAALLPTADEDAGRPVWRVSLGYARSWTVQTAGELAGSSVNRAAFTASEYRQAVSEDAARKTAWPEAPEHVQPTCLQLQADAEAEAARRLALYSGRQLVEVRCAAVAEVAAVEPGQTVRLSWPRWGLAAGKNFRVIGITRHDSADEIIFRLWG